MTVCRAGEGDACIRYCPVDRSPVSLDDCMTATQWSCAPGHVLGCSEMPHHAYVLSNSHGHDAISELTY